MICFSVFSSDILSGLQTKQAWQIAASFITPSRSCIFYLFTYFIRRVLGKIFPEQIKVAKFVNVISRTEALGASVLHLLLESISHQLPPAHQLTDMWNAIKAFSQEKI